MIRKILPLFCIAFLLVLSSIQTPAQQPAPPKFTGKLFGLTVDNVTDLNEVVVQLKEFKSRNPAVLPIVRVVFDVDRDARKFNRDYLQAVRRIKQETGMLVMGELMDSYHVHQCVVRNGRGEINENKSIACYEKRTRNYLNGLGDLVDIWEIGNEVNGEWVGWDDNQGGNENQPPEKLKYVRDLFAKQLGAAYQLLTRAGKQTAVTFYFNDEDFTGQGNGRKSWSHIEESLFVWAKNYRSFFPKVQYVFISYWEDDNFDELDGRDQPIVPAQATWANIFKTLKESFDNAAFGFGEVGTQCNYEKGDTTCRVLNLYGADSGKVLCRLEPAEIQPKRRCPCCLRAQTEYIDRYYLRDETAIRRELAKIAPRLEKDFVGGYFWWYFNDDVINKFTAANDEDTDSTEAARLRAEAERTRAALLNALNVWQGANPSNKLFGFAQHEKLLAAREAVYEVLQPGDTTKPNPYTIVIVNNPVIKKGRRYLSDPINLKPAKFAESVDYIYVNLFGNLPHQAEKLLAEPSIRDKIRVVAAFIPNLPVKKENSLIKIKGDFRAQQEIYAEFLKANNLDKADVVFAVTAYSPALKATAYRALETKDCAGVDFNFDGRNYRHCYYSDAPGAVAIHAENRSMTALHEFGHAASSYPNGFLNDLYTGDFTEKSLIINKKLFDGDKSNLPQIFAVYNNVPYPRDEKISEGDDGYLYSPKRIDVSFPSLMDDYRFPENGSPEECRFDTLTRQFLLDRIAAKINR